MLGIVGTYYGVMFINSYNTDKDQLIEEFQIKKSNRINQSFDPTDINGDDKRNIQFFELSTNKGIVELHTYMLKDSVKALMGRPQSTDVDQYGYNDDVQETWRYKGSNKYSYKFTINFINGELKSVDQNKESF